MKRNCFSLTLEEITAIFSDWGFTSYYATKFWKYLYQENISNIDQMEEIRIELRNLINENFLFEVPQQSYRISSEDHHTIKYLLRLADGEEIESVYMRYQKRVSACISTQVGCAMGCVFCATGQMGYTRNLTVDEIVGQVLHISKEAKKDGRKFRNIVLMGMGEPLHNYENVKKAIEIITHQQGLGIAHRHITLSTVGLVPQIYQLADDNIPIRLAVSLHGTTDEERRALVPMAKKWAIVELIDACKYYTKKMNWHIFFEWTLIEGKNDSVEHAKRLGELLKDVPSHVNLIRLNPTDGYNESPSNSQSVQKFKETLGLFDIPSTLRQRRGIDIDAGCGQLKKSIRG